MGMTTTPAAAYTLHEGDALRLLCELESASVDAVMTDPPYCSGGMACDSKRKFPDFEGDFRDQRNFMGWISQWLPECYRVTRPGGVLVTFIDWRMLPALTDAVQSAGWLWQGVVVWDKTPACRPQLGRFRNQAEYVVWASRGRLNTKAHPVVLDGVFTANPNAHEKQHQVGKPLALMEHLMRIVPPTSTVLDPFAGSATTGLAALRAGHRFIGMELSPGYCEVARKRLAAMA